MDENTIKINWEDAPEGTTHYDPTDKSYPWMKLVGDNVYFFGKTVPVWQRLGDTTEDEFTQLIPKPETTPTVDSYTDPKADPFTVSRKQDLTSQDNLAEYLKSIYDKVDQEEGDVGVFVIDMTASLEKQGEDMLNFLTAKKGAEKKDSNVSWYDYDKEELIGLPEKGEIVHDRHTQEDAEYLGKLHYEDTIILEDRAGRCYDRCITHLKPLNYKDSPKRQARKEQHKLLEDLVGDVDSNLQGYTHKAGAIELYNKGWRVSKEDV